MNEHENEEKLSAVSLYKVGNGYKLVVNHGDIGKRLDLAQSVLDAKVWQDIQRYMPHDTGTLISMTNALNASVSGKVYLFPPDSAYGHYQYEGMKYIDPVYHFAGFMTEEGWKSRVGVKKIPSGEPLKYTDPSAHAHWGEYAFQQHHQEWYDAVKRALGK